jgi:hypothetical protein
MQIDYDANDRVSKIAGTGFEVVEVLPEGQAATVQVGSARYAAAGGSDR